MVDRSKRLLLSMRSDALSISQMSCGIKNVDEDLKTYLDGHREFYGIVSSLQRVNELAATSRLVESDCTAPLTLSCGCTDMIERWMDYVFNN